MDNSIGRTPLLPSKLENNLHNKQLQTQKFQKL